MDYRAIRTRRYKYIHWLRYEPELYDLTADPYEMVNVIAEPGMAEVAKALRAELGQWVLVAMGLEPGRR